MNDTGKKKRPVLRTVIILFLAFIAGFAVYMVIDFRQAKNLAVEACGRAAAGMPLDDFLPAVSMKEYRMITRPDGVILVPRKGMGRFSCTVSHDGRKITGSKVAFAD